MTSRKLYTWPDGQTLGFARYGLGHWQHWHRTGPDAEPRQVGKIYPTKDALMIDSANYQRNHWDIGA